MCKNNITGKNEIRNNFKGNEFYPDEKKTDLIKKKSWKENMVIKGKQVFFRVKNSLMLGTLATDNRGMGVVEVILIILVLVGLVLVFKTNITTIVNTIFKKITTKVNSF